MALPASDNFNRANANPVGGNWSTITANNAMQITTNQLLGTAGANGNGVFWNADTPNADHYSQSIVPTVGNGGGIVIRIQSGAYSFYLANILPTYIRIYVVAGSNFTALGSDISYTYVSTDTYKLSVAGSIITMYVNGSSVGDRTDSTFTTGTFGLWSWDNTSYFDDWEGGNVSAGGATFPVPHLWWSEA